MPSFKDPIVDSGLDLFPSEHQAACSLKTRFDSPGPGRRKWP